MKKYFKKKWKFFWMTVHHYIVARTKSVIMLSTALEQKELEILLKKRGYSEMNLDVFRTICYRLGFTKIYILETGYIYIASDIKSSKEQIGYKVPFDREEIKSWLDYFERI